MGRGRTRSFFLDILDLAARMGDLGTPGGTAWAADPELGGRPYERPDLVRASGYLQAGDQVTCRIEAIGELRNRVARSN